MLCIGPHKLQNPVVLAPMAGVTDLPFRRLCRELGAGLVVSEMISSNPRLRNSRKTHQRLQHDGEPEPRSVQIAGNDPATMAQAASFNVANGAQIIDINMGCPARKVLKKAAGSALLRDEGLVAEILAAVVAAVDVPVTLKIRTGWSPQQRNGVSIARIAEDSGIAALAVHGRTRECAFSGDVEYDTIAQIVAAVSIPVIANGSIETPQQALAVMQYTGAAGVMLGRAAQGRPWLCGQVAHYLETGELLADPSRDTQLAILTRHLAALHQFYGEFLGPRVARKHVGWYLDGAQNTVFRREFNQLDSATGQLEAIHTLFSNDSRNKDLAA